jgi:hypothetical protein
LRMSARHHHQQSGHQTSHMFQRRLPSHSTLSPTGPRGCPPLLTASLKIAAADRPWHALGFVRRIILR